jgi:antitoxin (DNA-binding transcriptional repressor) of toxin-antitoxin stability system
LSRTPSPDKLTDVKTTNVRQITREWNRTLSGLKAGETLEVTDRGTPVAHITKPVPRVRRDLPNFAKIARHDDQRAGNRLLKRLLAEDEAIS